MHISIATDFSRVPAGRYKADGPYSGEGFRDDFLVPNLRKAKDTDSVLDVSIEGVEGLSSSFLEEAFGGLVRCCSFHEDDLRKILKISAESDVYESYIKIIWEYIEEAQLEIKQDAK